MERGGMSDILGDPASSVLNQREDHQQRLFYSIHFIYDVCLDRPSLRCISMRRKDSNWTPMVVIVTEE